MIDIRWWSLWKNALPGTNIAMENPPFWRYLTGKMGIFMGYVSFREGVKQMFHQSFFQSCGGDDLVLFFVLVFHPMGRLMFGFDKIGIVRKILSLMYILIQNYIYIYFIYSPPLLQDSEVGLSSKTVPKGFFWVRESPSPKNLHNLGLGNLQW